MRSVLTRDDLNEGAVVIAVIHLSSFSFSSRLRLDEENAEDVHFIFNNVKLRCVKLNLSMHAKRCGGQCEMGEVRRSMTIEERSNEVTERK